MSTRLWRGVLSISITRKKERRGGGGYGTVIGMHIMARVCECAVDEWGGWISISAPTRRVKKSRGREKPTRWMTSITSSVKVRCRDGPGEHSRTSDGGSCSYCPVRAPRIHSANFWLPDLAPPKLVPAMPSVERHANEALYPRPSNPP